MAKNSIKGYSICNVTNKMMEKEDSIKELEKIDINIKEKISEILKNKGIVYGVKEKNILKAVYLFENTNSENKNILVFKSSAYTDDTKTNIEQVEKIILEKLKEAVDWGKCSKVIWNDIEIEPNSIGGFSGITFSMCLSLGLIYGLIFNKLAFGLMLGLAIGLCFGSTVKKIK